MSQFVELEVSADAVEAEEEANDLMAEGFPGWEPAPGNLETWIFKALASMTADLAPLVVDASAEIFATFGTQIHKIPIGEAAAATGLTTWTAVDNSGYTMPSGVLVGIAATGSEIVAFRTSSEVQIPPGETSTGVGEVLIVAAAEGDEGNALTTNPALIDNLAFVASITLEEPTAGGGDAEDPDLYNGRLADRLSLYSTNVILAVDAARLVRSTIPGVARAAAIDNYNPADDTYTNEKMIAVSAIDDAGAGVGVSVKDAIAELLAGQRETNFVFNIVDPTSTTVKVAVGFVALAGFDPAAVASSVEAAIADYLSPARWGIPRNDPVGWVNDITVRRNELIALVDPVAGVDYIDTLTLAAGAATLGTADVTLAGPFALPTPGVITATAV